jgi:hypothetical protein
MQRQALRSTYRDVADIFYADTKTDGHGGVQKIWVQKYWGVKCRLYATAGRFTIAEGGIEYPVTQKMICDPDINIEKGDKIMTDDDNFIALQTDTAMDFAVSHKEVLLGRLEE